MARIPHSTEEPGLLLGAYTGACTSTAHNGTNSTDFRNKNKPKNRLISQKSPMVSFTKKKKKTLGRRVGLLLLYVSHIGWSAHRNHQDSIRDLVVVSRVRLLLEVPPSAQPLPSHDIRRAHSEQDIMCRQPVRGVVVLVFIRVLVAQQTALLRWERGQQNFVFRIFSTWGTLGAIRRVYAVRPV